MILALLAGGEVTARIDDWIRLGVPPLAAPDARFDLTVADKRITRGKPFGRHKNIQLNAAGFRGPPIQRQPPAGCVRVMILGASESVGEPGKDYPSRMQDSLARHECFEVQNAAMGGQHLAHMLQHWTDWASAWSPHIVVVYATPPFYLLDRPPGFRIDRRAPAARRPRRWTPRVLSRLATISLPEPIKLWSVRRAIAAKRQAHPPGWEFRELPADRVALFEQHMDSLTVAIQAVGARPILVTHAMRFPDPPTEEDEPLLRHWEQNSRATAEVILDYERATNASLYRIARRRGAMVVDAASVLNGRREWFTDFSHFTETGAAVLGGVIADSVRALSRRAGLAGSVR